MSNDNWIQDLHVKEGALTAQAKRHNMKPLEFARHVIENPEDFSGTTKRRANLALNLQVRKGGDKGIHIPYRDFVEEHKKLLGILKRPTKAKLMAEYKDQSKELGKVIGLRGGVMPESRQVLGDIAQASYDPNNASPINGWTVVYNSPTIKAYKKGEVIIIAVRGTKDARDVSAWTPVLGNSVANTSRYKVDVEIVKSLRQQFPNATFYAVGHSLGGAIIDNLINEGLVVEGLSFNPAVESKYFNDTRNQRIAHAEDPLYALMSNRAKNTTVINTPLNIQQPKITGISWLDNIANSVANRFGAKKAFDAVNRKLKAHSIGSIFGRGKCGKEEGECQCSSAFKAQLERNGYTCDKYLKDARAVAKKAGYDPKMLGFSMDTKHKLQILTPDGKVRRFGAVDYGDFLIWKHFERNKKVPKGFAKEKQNTFHASHSKIRGKWKDDKYSPNSLALAILW